MVSVASQAVNKSENFNYIEARAYQTHKERTSNSSQSTCPVGRVLWKELLEEVILHITPLCSLLHTLLKDKCVCAGRVKIVNHSSCWTSAISKYFCPLKEDLRYMSAHVLLNSLN